MLPKPVNMGFGGLQGGKSAPDSGHTTRGTGSLVGRDIKIGENWQDRIQAKLDSSLAVVLLISPAFLASDYVANNELPVLLKHAHDRNGDSADNSLALPIRKGTISVSRSVPLVPI